MYGIFNPFFMFELYLIRFPLSNPNITDLFSPKKLVLGCTAVEDIRFAV